MKPLFCALALCTMLAPAMAQEAATAPEDKTPVGVPYMPTVKLDSGISITPVLRTPSDLERMTDVHFWQFHLQLPATVTYVPARIYFRVPGKSQRLVGTGGLDFLKGETDLIVGIAPVTCNSLSTAGEWKIYYRTQEIPEGPDKPARVSSSVQANPIKDLKFESTRYGVGDDYALPDNNGDAPLMSLYRYERNDQGNKEILVAELVLTFINQKPQPQK